MKMQLWELKEKVDALVEKNGDSTWLNAHIGFAEGAGAHVAVVVNEREL